MVQTKQTNLYNEWDVVNYNIGQNHSKRINWKDFFYGKSLTQVITENKEKGYSAEETYNIITNKYCISEEELLKKIRISVYSRFAEQKTYTKRKGGK